MIDILCQNKSSHRFTLFLSSTHLHFVDLELLNGITELCFVIIHWTPLVVGSFPEWRCRQKHNFSLQFASSPCSDTVRTYTLYFKPPISTRTLIFWETNLFEIQKKKPGWALGAKDGEGGWDGETWLSWWWYKPLLQNLGNPMQPLFILVTESPSHINFSNFHFFSRNLDESLDKNEK